MAVIHSYINDHIQLLARQVLQDLAGYNGQKHDQAKVVVGFEFGQAICPVIDVERDNLPGHVHRGEDQPHIKDPG